MLKNKAEFKLGEKDGLFGKMSVVSVRATIGGKTYTVQEEFHYMSYDCQRWCDAISDFVRKLEEVGDDFKL